MASYSHSRLGTFLQCHQKYKFQYVDKIKSEDESIEAFMGKLVHATLEKLYRDLKFQKFNSKEELLRHYAANWESQWHDKIIIVKEYAAENYKEMGQKFITDYYDHYTPFDSLVTLGLETADLMPLENGNSYHVRIDRLACDKERNYYVCDYKTNSALKPQEELDEDKQLAMYSLWVKKKYPDAHAVKLVWYFLAFDKEMVSERNDEQLLQLKADTELLITEIESCSNFPPNVTPLCDYCAYRRICPAWKHEIELEKKTPEQFNDDDGVKLVDELSVLDRRERAAQERKEEIKEKLIRFAQQKGISVVWGTDAKASVKPYDKIEYPKTELFMDLLKSKGLYDELVVVNYSKFQSKVLKRQVPVEILNQIKTQQGWMVRLSRRKDE